MNLATLEAILPELQAALIGRRCGKVFPLSRHSIAIDLRLDDSRYLFINIEPANPCIYLIRRRMRDLEKQSLNSPVFVMQMKRHLAGLEVMNIEMLPDERVVCFELAGTDEMGEIRNNRLVVQLTGKSSNLFVADGRGMIIDAFRETLGDGQSTGEIYSPPLREGETTVTKGSVPSTSGFSDLSEALDAAELERKAESEFRSLAGGALSKVNRDIAKIEKLKNHLNNDLANHGDAERWKRYGDLLLASVATAKRDGSKLIVTDYFHEDLAAVEIEADENDSVTETAERYFRKYTKARNARDEIARRMETIVNDLESLRNKRKVIETAIAERDADALRPLAGTPRKHAPKAAKKASAESSIYRSFVSSEGFEILVGKKAKDNDQLTFKIAKSLDTWMHAADYPGSHVVIRNPNRKQIPPKTLLEAAQLAAFYSQGKAQPKAAVHYTQKKFVNKPKGAAPGLVSLASFKTLLVEPNPPEIERSR